MEQILGKMVKIIIQQESKILDQKSRSRWENLRLREVPEEPEGLSMETFVEKLLWDSLEIPQATSLGIERTHRALTLKESRGQ